MRYNIYKPEYSNFKGQCDKLGITAQQLVAGMDAHSLMNYGKKWDQTLDCQLFVTEHDWIDTGKHVVFIKSQKTIDKLMGLKFKPKQGVMFSFPWHTFTLATPKGAKYDDVEIMPTFVHHGTGDQAVSISYKYYEKYGLRAICNGICYPWETKLKLAIPDSVDNPNCSKSVLNLSDQMVIDILSLKNFDDVPLLRKMIGQVDTSDRPLSDYEIRQEAIHMRLILAMSIYNQITGGEYLTSGIPGGFMMGHKQSTQAKKDFRNYRKHTFDLGQDKKSVSEFVRSGHYRQLVDERFYRGEHANKPIGSRWVQVKAALIGGGKPSTQTMGGD